MENETKYLNEIKAIVESNRDEISKINKQIDSLFEKLNYILNFDKLKEIEDEL